MPYIPYRHLLYIADNFRGEIIPPRLSLRGASQTLLFIVGGGGFSSIADFFSRFPVPPLL